MAIQDTQTAKVNGLTLADLRVQRVEWLQQGHSMFSNLAMLAQALGVLELLRHRQWLVYDNGMVTITWSENFVSGSPNGTVETITVTVGDHYSALEQKVMGPHMRTIQVARLQRLKDTNSNPDAYEEFFRPGRWIDFITPDITRAHQVMADRAASRDQAELDHLCELLHIGMDL